VKSVSAWKFVLVGGMLGLLMSAVIMYSFDKGFKLTEKYLPLGQSVMAIKLDIQESHIRSEEVIYGKSSNELDPVWDLSEPTPVQCHLPGRGNRAQRPYPSPAHGRSTNW